MPSIRTRFTYLWLLIVACCIVTKPAVAAPITAQVVTIKCNGVYKQILLIGVDHDSNSNDDECFTRLKDIIASFTEKHKAKRMNAIPLLFEAPDYQGRNRSATSIEFCLANWCSRDKNGIPSFNGINVDRRRAEELKLLSVLNGILEFGTKVDDWSGCGLVTDYQRFFKESMDNLKESLVKLKSLGLTVQNKQNKLLQDSEVTSLYRQLGKMNIARSFVGQGSFTKLYVDVCRFGSVLDTSLLVEAKKIKNDGTRRVLQVLVEGGKQKEWILDELGYFIADQRTNASFFAQLVDYLADNDKIILFCGAGHIEGQLSGGSQYDGLIPLFCDFGCTVKEIESYSEVENQKYISPSRLQEIFTNFISCCNTCGKTKHKDV